MPEETEESDVLTSLRSHQKRVRDRIGDQEGLVAAHDMGSGKTLSAISAIDQVRQENENAPVRVLTPASLRENFRKEVEKHTEDGLTGPKPELESHTGATREGPVEDDVAMRVVDEAHRARSTGSKFKDRLKKSPADKNLLMTGTPVYNHPFEIGPLVNIAAGEHKLPETKSQFENKFVNEEEKYPGGISGLAYRVTGGEPGIEKKLDDSKSLRNPLKNYVDYYEPDKDNENYPDVEKEEVKVPMSDKQKNAYRYMLRDLPMHLRWKMKDQLPPGKEEASKLMQFLNGPRQVANAANAFDEEMGELEGGKDSPKIQQIADDLENNEDRQQMVYSNFLESGLEPLKSVLDERGVDYAEYTGSAGQTKREKDVKRFNEGDVSNLLVSSAGGEGLDLENVRDVHVMEPHWNEQKINQVVARARRYKSHEDLPEDERKINVKRYLTELPKNTITNSARSLFGADQTKTDSIENYVQGLAKDKQKLNEQLVQVLKEETPEMNKDASFKTPIVKEAVEPTSPAQDFAAGFDPLGVWTTRFAKRNEEAGLSETDHAKRQAINAAGGLLGGGFAVPTITNSLIEGGQSAYKGSGTKGTVLGLGAGMAEGAVAPWKKLSRGLKSVDILENAKKTDDIYYDLDPEEYSTLKSSIKDSSINVGEASENLKSNLGANAGPGEKVDSFFGMGEEAGDLERLYKDQKLSPDLAETMLPKAKSQRNRRFGQLGVGAGIGSIGAGLQYNMGKNMGQEKNAANILKEASPNVFAEQAGQLMGGFEGYRQGRKASKRTASNLAPYGQKQRAGEAADMLGVPLAIGGAFGGMTLAGKHSDDIMKGVGKITDNPTIKNVSKKLIEPVGAFAGGVGAGYGTGLGVAGYKNLRHSSSQEKSASLQKESAPSSSGEVSLNMNFNDPYDVGIYSGKHNESNQAAATALGTGGAATFGALIGAGTRGSTGQPTLQAGWRAVKDGITDVPKNVKDISEDVKDYQRNANFGDAAKEWGKSMAKGDSALDTIANVGSEINKPLVSRNTALGALGGAAVGAGGKMLYNNAAYGAGAGLSSIDEERSDDQTVINKLSQDGQEKIGQDLESYIVKDAIGDDQLERIYEAGAREIQQNLDSASQNSSFTPGKDPVSLYDYLQNYDRQQQAGFLSPEEILSGAAGESDKIVDTQTPSNSDSPEGKRHVDLGETLDSEGRPIGDVDSSRRVKGVRGGELGGFIANIDQGNTMWASAHPEVGAYYGTGMAGNQGNASPKNIENWGEKTQGYLFDLNTEAINSEKTTPHIATNPFTDPEKWKEDLSNANGDQPLPDRLSTFEAAFQPGENASLENVVNEARMVSEEGVSDPKSIEKIREIGNQNLGAVPREARMTENMNLETYIPEGSTSPKNVEPERARGNFVDMSGGFGSMDDTAKSLANNAGSMFKKLSSATPIIHKDASVGQNFLDAQSEDKSESIGPTQINALSAAGGGMLGVGGAFTNNPTASKTFPALSAATFAAGPVYNAVTEDEEDSKATQKSKKEASADDIGAVLREGEYSRFIGNTPSLRNILGMAAPPSEEDQKSKKPSNRKTKLSVIPPQ